MVLNTDTPQEFVLTFGLLLQQFKRASQHVFPVVLLVVSTCAHHVFEELVEVHTLFHELLCVSFLELLRCFVLFKALSRYLSVDFAPGHRGVVYKPVDYVNQGFNIILVSALVSF